jgi:DNA-binding NtrC family response regulator
MQEEVRPMTLRLLVVDDESATAFGLKALLQGEDVEVLTAVNALTARSILMSERVDVLLSDIRLSGTQDAEGIELLQFARVNSPETRVIMMTGYGAPAIQARAEALGAAAYFEKPVDIAVLITAIRRLGGIASE